MTQTYADRAEALFRRGYNCAQSVFAAFCDLTGLEEDYALRLASSLGGGIGRLREVCGAVSGMALVCGALYGYDTCNDDEQKAAHYARVQELAFAFREKNGSFICRELLGLAEDHSNPTPSPRTAQYYAARDCAAFVRCAAELIEQYIKDHPV